MTVIGSLGRDLQEVNSSVNPYISACINANLAAGFSMPMDMGLQNLRGDIQKGTVLYDYRLLLPAERQSR
jgi:hypothetical protein